MKNLFNSATYFIFSTNLSLFDLFWITLIVHFASEQPLFLLGLIPLIIISSIMKVVADKQDEVLKK
jgi:hypothetical protein